MGKKKERGKYVSRAGEKLEAGLDAFRLDVRGKIAADVGASTGGFTDVLLSREAEKVYAIDVGYGDLAWKLRQDPRVVVLERTNVRHLEKLPEQVDFVSIDVSFISLKLVLPRVVDWLKPDGSIVALIKPQFEAAREEVPPGGVITDENLQNRIAGEVEKFAETRGLVHRGTIKSPVRGSKGNQEFLAFWKLKD